MPLKVGPVEISNGLSVLLSLDPDATIQGLDAWPASEQPPAEIVHLAFHLMGGLGVALAGLAAWYGLARWRHRDLPRSRLFWRAATLAGLGGVLALEAGWTVTEVGRQPWIVYGVMRTAEAVNTAGGLAGGLYAVLVVYTALGVTTILVLRRLRRRQP